MKFVRRVHKLGSTRTRKYFAWLPVSIVKMNGDKETFWLEKVRLTEILIKNNDKLVWSILYLGSAK